MSIIVSPSKRRTLIQGISNANSRDFIRPCFCFAGLNTSSIIINLGIKGIRTSVHARISIYISKCFIWFWTNINATISRVISKSIISCTRTIWTIIRTKVMWGWIIFIISVWTVKDTSFRGFVSPFIIGSVAILNASLTGILSECNKRGCRTIKWLDTLEVDWISKTLERLIRAPTYT